MKLFKRTTGLCALLLITACAGEQYHREGLALLSDGKTNQGLAKLEQATKEEPQNARFRMDYLRERTDYINRTLALAETERGAGNFERSESFYKEVLEIEPANKKAMAGLEALDRDKRHLPLLELAKDALKRADTEQAAVILKPILSENPNNANAILMKRKIDDVRLRDMVSEPILRTNQRKPINLEFRDANLKIVFEALARTTGVNFILDKDVRPDLRTTVFLQQSTLEDAIELILQTNKLEKKVLNSNTILVYPNTPEKIKDYQELVVKGFYLANADVKRTETMLKSMLKIKDMFVEEKLNMIMIRDTPEAVRLAEKLIAMHDMYEPEVMLEVEVLEVNRSRLTELGVQWPTKLTLTPLNAAGGTTTTLSDLKNINSDRLGASIGSASINLRRVIGDANILANPRIRARNREKAQIMIGDKVPVVNTTTTANGFVSENTQYLDVGIKLEVEPDIHLQDEVGIKIGLEVSSIVKEITTPAGSLAYQLGSRSASTVLRLKDGETQVLAGLINNEERAAANRVPGLGDVPILGRLFSDQTDSRNKTEVVLSITPHLIRNIDRPDAAVSEFWSGTESGLRTKPLLLQPMRQSNTSSSSSDEKSPGSDAVPSNSGIGAMAKDPTAISLALDGPSQVKAGEVFNVSLKIKTDGDLSSLPFQIAFDPTIFQVIAVNEGAFFKQNEGKTSISTNVDPSLGKIFGTVLRSGGGGARGEDAIAVVSIRALKNQSQGEMKILSATPISSAGKTVAPIMPVPFLIKIE